MDKIRNALSVKSGSTDSQSSGRVIERSDSFRLQRSGRHSWVETVTLLHDQPFHEDRFSFTRQQWQTVGRYVFFMAVVKNVRVLHRMLTSDLASFKRAARESGSLMDENFPILLRSFLNTDPEICELEDQGDTKGYLNLEEQTVREAIIQLLGILLFI